MTAPIGVGLRSPHYPYLLEKPQTKVTWFEAITENFLDTEGNPLHILEKIREDYSIGLHGVSLNLGSYGPLNNDYLKKVKTLYDRFDPFVISDHLCWTGSKDNNLHNLLPLIYDQETLDYLVDRVSKVQDFFGREICLENLSAYLHLKESTMTEWEFLNELANRSGCKILLDINNVYVNSINQKFDSIEYLNGIAKSNIGEIHLAGYSDMGDFLFDTHSNPVFPEVWKLFEYKIKELNNVPVLIEWDEDIPDFSVLEDEADKARSIWERYHD